MDTDREKKRPKDERDDEDLFDEDRKEKKKQRRADDEEDFEELFDDEEKPEPKKKSKGRKHQEQDEEEDEEDMGEDEDEEEEEDQRGKGKGKKGKKKAKKTGSSLLELEAEVDEDDDDEAEGDDFGDLIAPDNEAELVEARQAAAQRDLARQRLKDERGVVADQLERMAERYSRFDEYDEDDADEDLDIDYVAGEGPEPTENDPKLFMVRCKNGHEREAVICLLQKAHEMERRGMPLGVSCVVAPDHLKGCVYVESNRQDDVKTACQGLQILTAWNPVLVPIAEMKHVLAVPPRTAALTKGDWVRMLRGPYAGDLAQVYQVRPGSGTDRSVTVRLIPRLDLLADRRKYENQNEHEDEAGAGGDAKHAAAAKKKADRRKKAQKLFDKHEVEKYGSGLVSSQKDRTLGESFDLYEKEMFRHGLVYKHVTPKSVLSGPSVDPKFEEVSLYREAEERMQQRLAGEDDDDDAYGRYDDGERDLGLNSTGFSASQKISFFIGDRIVFSKTELRGLQAPIISIDSQVIRVKIEQLNGMTVLVTFDQISKVFNIGSHVAVAQGKHKGEKGSVVAVQGSMVVIFSETSRQELKLKASQLAESSEYIASSNKKALGGGAEMVDAALAATRMFQLFDMVSLRDDETYRGIVVKLEEGRVRAMGVTGKLLDVRDDELRKVTESFGTLDKNQSPLKEGDSVRVVSGRHLDRTGTVKRIYRDAVFFQAKDEIENCGILVVNSQEVVVQSIGRMGGHFGFRPPLFSATGQGGTQATNSSNSGAFGAFNTRANPSPGGSTAFGFQNRGNTGGGNFGAKPFSNGSGGPRGGPGGFKDQLLNSFVTIRRGDYKGYRARVIDTAGDKVTIVIQSKMKKIIVPRDMVKPVDSLELPAVKTNPLLVGSEFPRSSSGSGTARGSGGSLPGPSSSGLLDFHAKPDTYDNIGSQTPIHSHRPETPAGLKTPAYDSMATPIASVWKSQKMNNPYASKPFGVAGSSSLAGAYTASAVPTRNSATAYAGTYKSPSQATGTTAVFHSSKQSESDVRNGPGFEIENLSWLNNVEVVHAGENRKGRILVDGQESLRIQWDDGSGINIELAELGGKYKFVPAEMNDKVIVLRGTDKGKVGIFDSVYEEDQQISVSIDGTYIFVPREDVLKMA